MSGEKVTAEELRLYIRLVPISLREMVLAAADRIDRLEKAVRKLGACKFCVSGLRIGSDAKCWTCKGTGLTEAAREALGETSDG